MTRAEWSQYLFAEFVRSRAYPGWPILLNQFDNEDRAYFSMLEEEKNKRRIIVAEPS